MNNNTSIETINHQERDVLAQSWSRLIACISHDLVSPLMIWQLSTLNLEKIFPKLLHGYYLAVENNLLSESVSKDNQKYIQLAEQNILAAKKDIPALMQFLRTLYPINQSLLCSSTETTLFSVIDSIQAAVTRYPFVNEQEQELIHSTLNHDFKFSNTPFFIENLLDHLLSNAFIAIHKAGKGEIFIFTNENENYNQLHFKDTATGISDQKLGEIFNRFFSKRDGKQIPGLGFCRLALLQRGGNIICHSVEGDYTEFVLQFPKN